MKCQKESLSKPPAPSPSASRDEVRAFLTEHFVSLLYTQTQAKEMANRSHIDGLSIYTIRKEAWDKKYSEAGMKIYHHLQSSKYGYVCRNNSLLSLYSPSNNLTDC